MLKMKPGCERCKAAIDLQDDVFICSYECTFCRSCTDDMASICPNCDGELVRRPVRDRAPLPVTMGLMQRRIGQWFGRVKR